MQTQIEDRLLEFFKALAEPNRLKIVGVLARSDHTVEELAAMLDLRESTVSHHLSLLAQAGLVSARAEGYYSVYQLKADALHRMAASLLAKETLPKLAQDVDPRAYDESVLRRYSDTNGKLKTLPAQEKKFVAILRYATTLFDKKKRYTEKEVNKIFAKLHDDTASLRRGMIEFKLMKREKGIYWLV